MLTLMMYPLTKKKAKKSTRLKVERKLLLTKRKTNNNSRTIKQLRSHQERMLSMPGKRFNPQPLQTRRSLRKATTNVKTIHKLDNSNIDRDRKMKMTVKNY